MTSALDFQAGTGRGLMRRLHDARFGSRFFVGHGMDVGCGNDSLEDYQTFFPLMKSCRGWDVEDGDAARLADVKDASLDFLYSSHCLEHLGNPLAAMMRWIRVVRPGGHLVIVIPDEQLYEQGVWPSTYNSDHRCSFTLRTQSDPKFLHSINVIGLLSDLASRADPFRVLKVEQLDHAYYYQLGFRADQTRPVYGEAGIEIILQRGPFV